MDPRDHKCYTCFSWESMRLPIKTTTIVGQMGPLFSFIAKSKATLEANAWNSMSESHSLLVNAFAFAPYKEATRMRPAEVAHKTIINPLKRRTTQRYCLSFVDDKKYLKYLLWFPSNKRGLFPLFVSSAPFIFVSVVSDTSKFPSNLLMK